jgi:hypothetical protein
MKTLTTAITAKKQRWAKILRGDSVYMGNDNKKKSTSNNKKNDGTFRSKHVKHDPNAEGARAVFGLKENTKSEQQH